MSQQKSRLMRPENVYQIFYSLNLVSSCELQPQFPVLSWHEQNLWWSSAAVAHLLRGSNALLHSLGCMGAFPHREPLLSYFSDHPMWDGKMHSENTQISLFGTDNSTLRCCCVIG